MTSRRKLENTAQLKKPSKQNLPSKICVVCQRPFSWRKKWQRDWENVKFCSERCRRSGAAV